MSLTKRLSNIARSFIHDKIESLEKNILHSFKEKNEFSESSTTDFSDSSSFQNQSIFENQYNDTFKNQEFSEEFIEDLKMFSLKPPSSLQEVKTARNKEIKKYHPDLFIHEPEKLETAKKIIQKLNASYERLKKYYSTNH